MNLSSHIFVALFFILFNKAIEGKGMGTDDNGKMQGVTKKKLSKKQSTSQPVDISELLADMIQKDAELVEMTKKKSKYKTLTGVLATTMGLMALVLGGSIGLVLYNTSNERPPFSLRFRKDGDKNKSKEEQGHNTKLSHSDSDNSTDSGNNIDAADTNTDGDKDVNDGKGTGSEKGTYSS